MDNLLQIICLSCRPRVDRRRGSKLAPMVHESLDLVRNPKASGYTRTFIKINLVLTTTLSSKMY